MHSLPEAGYLRLAQIIGRPAQGRRLAITPLIPVSKSTWWAGVRSGRFPRPTKVLGPGMTAWRVEDIRAFIEHGSAGVVQ